METDSAAERENALGTLHELDCQAPLRVREVLRLGRLLAFCGLLVVPMLGPAAHQQRLPNLLEGLLAAALCLAVLNLAAFVTSRLLTLAEIGVYAAILVVLVVVAVKSAVFAASDFDEAVKFMFALILWALAASLVYWIMYPGELGHVWDPGQRFVPRVVLMLVIGWLLFLTRQAVPSDRGGEFLWLSGGLLALFVFLKVFIPLAWSLPRGRPLQLLHAVKRNRKARRNGGYIFYLFTHANSRLGPLLYAVCCPILACISYLYLVGFGPFGEIGELLPGLEWPFVRQLLFAGGLVLAGLSYRKALEKLAEGIDQTEAQYLTASGGFTLYLRSFQDDATKFDLATSGWRRLLLVSGLWEVYQRVFRYMRLEEMIARTLWPYRPVVGVASTGNVIAVMPSLVGYASSGAGALQIHLPNETWQARVLQLAQKAECIVMIMAGTPGLRWEFEQLALRSELREKMVLLVPPSTLNERAPSSLGEPDGTQDDLTARWRGLFGESEGGPSLRDEALLRTVAIRFERDGGGILFTAGEHSAAAYRLALNLAQLPPQETALAAKPSVEGLVPGTALSSTQTPITKYVTTTEPSVGARKPSPEVACPRWTSTWPPSVTRTATARTPSDITEPTPQDKFMGFFEEWSTLAIVGGIVLLVLAFFNFWPDANSILVAIGAVLLAYGLIGRIRRDAADDSTSITKS